MDYKKEIGRRIQAARDACGWSLVELSKKLGGRLSASRISNYEQGTRLPGPQEVNLLAEALGESAAWLACLESEMSHEEEILLRNWRALPENQRVEYARRIEMLAMAYRVPVSDEKLKGWKSPASKKDRERQ